MHSFFFQYRNTWAIIFSWQGYNLLACWYIVTLVKHRTTPEPNNMPSECHKVLSSLVRMLRIYNPSMPQLCWTKRIIPATKPFGKKLHDSWTMTAYPNAMHEFRKNLRTRTLCTSGMQLRRGFVRNMLLGRMNRVRSNIEFSEQEVY